MKLDDDSDEEGEEGKEGQENANSISNSSAVFAVSSNATEEKKPQLTQEELEAKQGKTDTKHFVKMQHAWSVHTCCFKVDII